MTPQRRNKLSQKGFTLIEVVIAMSIMAFLTVMVSQSMRRSTDFKTKIQKNIDQRSAINSAMRIIERDINLAFHYQDINTEVLKEIEKKKKSASGGGRKPGPDGKLGTADDIIDPAGGGGAIYQNFKIREIPVHTVFVGAKESIHFTNLNNITVQPGEKVSDQQEVGYFVKNCKSLVNPEVSTKCLWRRTSPFIDDKVEEGGTETVLIENVKKFELRYFGKEKEDWVDTWDSSPDNNDDTLKNKFPSAVEVTLTIEQNKKEVSAIRVVALRFPNNIEPAGAPKQQMGQGPSEVDFSKEGE